MIVPAESGPLHYLILLEQVDLLRRFYGQVTYHVSIQAHRDEILSRRIFG